MHSMEGGTILERCMNGRVLYKIGASFYSDRQDEKWMEAMMRNLCEVEVDVAYLHGCTGLHGESAFRALLDFLRKGQVWAVNLGELELGEAQLDELTKALEESSVTHMFYECESLGPGRKDAMREAVRRNRSKHRRWSMADVGDEEGRRSILQCRQMWFNPMSHAVNLPFAAA
jgi:hypothetical protein